MTVQQLIDDLLFIKDKLLSLLSPDMRAMWRNFLLTVIGILLALYSFYFSLMGLLR